MGSFEAEWAASKAATQQPVGMRLNRADDGPVGGGGGDQDLSSDAGRKKTAANDIETDFEPNTKKAGAWAKEATDTSMKAFDGWATAAGLKKAEETWGNQAKALMGRLAGEKSALRGTNNLFIKNDQGIGDELARQSKLYQLSQHSHN
ncbi:hypothetical protein [Streptomyces sp. CBMA152]|uniref:hypothetical protein n=1 Tax=Streptomyces sp. CBMA152 TaxID=1896312 RepID=UPI001660F6E9|nr:hypothetical protein [Streptomyces sp. CBMA152]MBD0741690.1 hypothetical protein [Streptomyces sp. CBMA152]